MAMLTDPSALAVQFLNGVSFIAILVLVALGLVIIFGMMGVINLAHGEFFMVGAYTVYAVTKVGGSFWLGVLAALGMTAVLGMALERSVIRFLYHRPFETILATWGVSLFLQELARTLFGPGNLNVPAPISGALNLGLFLYPAYRIFVIAVGFGLFSLVLLIFLKTNFGVRARAVIQNREAASALGINISRMNLLSFMLGSGLAGVAGAVMAPLVGVSSTMGLAFIVQSFMSVILGGLGHIANVLGGAAVIGGFETIFTLFTDPVAARTTVLALVLLLIAWRPQGLFGQR